VVCWVLCWFFGAVLVTRCRCEGFGRHFFLPFPNWYVALDGCVSQTVCDFSPRPPSTDLDTRSGFLVGYWALKLFGSVVPWCPLGFRPGPFC